ncbi:MAG TPA: protease inhibitor I42 family protein [Nitrososphaeraceae archaeon]|nr:protease inhibitor I42 family protein [Nitrososphaeraceae archaeon]
MLSNTGSLAAQITFGQSRIQQQHNLAAVENIKNKEDNITTNKVSFVVNSTMENKKQDENITVKKGQEFTIILESNPSTGYQWIPTFNTSIINLVSHNFQPSTKLMGSPGTDTFKFKATNQGTEPLKMIYKRSWEKEFVKEKVFKINVTG